MISILNDDRAEEYIRENSTEEARLLRELEEETYRNTRNPRMLSGFLQGRLLAFISQLVKPERILEVGTFTGYSALCLCEGLTPGGMLHTIECNDEIIPIAKKYFTRSAFSNQIILHSGNALSIIPELTGPFQLVYLDGNKEEYPLYFALVADKISPGGVLICDNVLWSGKVFDQPAQNDSSTKQIRKFTEDIRKDTRFECLIVPVRDGILLARKK